MRSALMVIVGLGLLALFMIVGRAATGALGMSPAALYFVPAWFVCALGYFVVSLRRGASLRAEAPVAALIFAIPAAVALLLSWKLS
jgi:hypothetical protein